MGYIPFFFCVKKWRTPMRYHLWQMLCKCDGFHPAPSRDPEPTPSVGHVTGEMKQPDSLTVNIKTEKISETWILACFAKICTRENHLPYDSYVQTKMILESFISVLPIVTYRHRWSIHQLDITITLVRIVLASGYLLSPAYSKGTRLRSAQRHEYALPYLQEIYRKPPK